MQRPAVDSLGPLSRAVNQLSAAANVPELFLWVGPAFASLAPKTGAVMVQRVSTVAFEGIEALAVDVQVQVAPGLPAFNIGAT
jgi:hypothetical protein